MKKNGTIVLSLVLVFLVLFGAGCSKQQIEGDSSKSVKDVKDVKDTLFVGIPGEPTHLDATKQGVATNGYVNAQIYEKLVVMDPETGEITPALAESWEMVDNTTWKFNIRKDVTFHNGTKLTAEDILYSFRVNNSSGGFRWMWGAIDTDNSYVVDNYTLVIKTYDTYAGLIAMLSSQARIVCKSLYEEIGPDEYARNPIGTGPYMITEWIAGDGITLTRYDEYWGNAPYFKNIVFRFIGDGTTRSFALETGEIDIAMDIPVTQIENLKSTGLTDIINNPSLSIDYFGFNCQKEPFKNAKVRQALRYAIDLDSMVNIAYGLTADVADGICTPTFCDYTPAEGKLVYTYDIEKAKELLKEAGYPDGFSCKLMVISKQSRLDMVEMLQNAWKKIGVDIEVYVTELGSYYEIMASGDYEMFYGGWRLLANDGDLMHDTFYSTPELWYSTNYTAYVNPEFDALVDAARVETDLEKRSQYYKDVQNLIRRELPFVACTWNKKISAMSNTLTGYVDDVDAPSMAYIIPKK